MSPLFRDATGNDGQFAINHLGHFRLAQRLMSALERTNRLGLFASQHRAPPTPRAMRRVKPWAADMELADRLWELSERLLET